MKIKNRQLESILILSVLAVSVNIILNLHCGLDFDYKGLYNQSIFFAITYICISKILMLGKKYNMAMIIGHVFFGIYCGLIYYSSTIIDYVSLLISFYTTVTSILLIQHERNEYESRK